MDQSLAETLVKNTEDPVIIDDGNLLLLNYEYVNRELNGEKFILNRLCFDNGHSMEIGESNDQTLTIFIRSQKPLTFYNVGSHYKVELQKNVGVTIDKKFYDISLITIFR